MHDQRGATLAEYALLVGLVALVCLGAITVLGLRSKDTVEEVSAQVDRGERPPGDGDGGGGGGGGRGGGTADGGSGGDGGTGDSSGDGVTTTTTTTTTSTTTTTTTTAPPPTTTTPGATTSTTVDAPLPGSDYPLESGFADATRVVDGLDWRVETGMVLWSQDGTPLRDTDATVEIWRHVLTRYGWRWARSLVPVTTGSDGTVPFTTPEYPGWGSNAVDRVVVRIVSVDDPAWDGSIGTLDVSI